MEEILALLKKYSRFEDLLISYCVQNSENQELKLTYEESFENLIQFIKDEAFVEDSHNFLFFLRFLHNMTINDKNIIELGEKIKHLLAKFNDTINNSESKEIKQEYELILKHISEDNENNEELDEHLKKLTELIQKDSVSEFMKFIEESEISIDSIIDFSKYDKNVKNDNYSIISYCAFLGSIQLFRYLLLNNVSIDPEQICHCAIHGRNHEIIHLLEDNHYLTIQQPFYASLIEDAIRMYHNEIANYLIENNSGLENCNSKELLYDSIEFMNCDFISLILPIYKDNLNDIFTHFCTDEYYYIVDNLLKTQNIDINQKDEIFSKYSLMIYTYLLFYKEFDC